MTKTPKLRPLILALDTELSYTFGHVNGTFLTRNEDGEMCNWSERFSSDRRSPQLPALDDLTISCQWNEDREDKSPYAWDVRFMKPWAVDLNLAERLVMTLKTIDRIIQRKKLFDYTPEMTYGRFVQGLAKGMGVDEVVWVEGDYTQTNWLRDYTYVPVPMKRVADEVTRRTKLVQSGEVPFRRTLPRS